MRIHTPGALITVVRSLDPGRKRFAFGMAMLATCSGLFLGIVVSGGILSERLTLGAPSEGMLASAVASISAIVAARVAFRRAQVVWVETDPRSDQGPVLAQQLHAFVVLLPQAFGIAMGIALVHVLLRFDPFGSPTWLSEAPAQFVNDSVGALGLLALAWACARNLDVLLLVLTLAVLTIYVATASHWHVDHAPAGYQMTVQQYVVAQCLGAAAVLALLSSPSARDENDI